MPELKNLFVQGKMNKDLDERLVPQGEYRDANNIDVSYSDGSNVGAIEPITGTVSVGVYTFDLTDAHCVGSVVDTENDKFYGLIYSPTVNLIVEYGTRDTPDARQVVLADTGSVLNFDPTRLITGINILDGILYFTDNYSEPKQVDIEYWKDLNNTTATVASGTAGNTTITLNEDISTKLQSLLDGGDNTVYVYGSGITQHATVTSISGTTLVVSSVSSTSAPGGTLMFSTLYTTPGLSEDRITVIKKSPFSAPSLTLKNTKRTVNLSAEVASGAAGNTTITLTASTELQFLLNVWSSVYVYGTGISDGATVVSISGTTLVVSSVSSTVAPSGTLTFATPIGPKKIHENFYSANYIDNDPFTVGDQPIEVGDIRGKSNFGSTDPYANYNWQVGDKIKIYNNDYDAYAIEEITSLSSSNGIITEVKALVGDFPDKELTWKAELIEEPIVYESKFIRFAYRWKYEINGTTQYSLISPFSETAFIPGNFKYNTLKGFNLAMENTLQKITISGFETAPSGVAKIEVLLKYSNSPNIYKIKELNSSEESFSFEKEILGEAIPSNQLLRVYDSVPKKAKSQEIVANRLIYGNYTQNFDISSKPTFEIGLINRSNTSNDNQSIKTIRNYQFGVVYFDEYNRQTPVFTDTSGAFSVPIGGGDNLVSLYSSSQFKAKLTNTAPSWASKYKYYIKENTNEYYNLALAGAYKTDNGFYYLAFPSSEVNKVQEGDYIIMKKSFGNTIVESLEKNKILSIEAEAPDEIAKEKITETVVSHASFSPALEDNHPLAVELAGGSPTTNSNQFVLSGARKTPGTFWDGDGTPSAADYQGEGLSTDEIDKIKASSYVRFSIGPAKTKYYKISKAVDTTFLYYQATTNDLRNHIEVTLEEPFTTDIDFLYEYRGEDSVYSVSLDDNVLKPNITVSFYSENDVSKKFAGQFFVKVQQNAVLNNLLQLNSEKIIVDGTKLYTDDSVDSGGGGTGKFYIFGGGKAGTPDNTIANNLGGADVYDSITWQLTLQHRYYTTLSPNYSFKDAIKIGAKFRFKDYQAVSANFSKEEDFMGVATLEIINGGSNYSSNTNVAVTGGSGENLTINTTVTGGEITAVTIGNNAGVRYKNGDIITVSGGDENATIKLTVVEEEIYTITDLRAVYNTGSPTSVDVYYINFDKNFIKDLPFYNSNSGFLGDHIEVEVIEDKDEFDLIKEKNPPIFETYPEENELELFYETQETFDVSTDHGNFNNLKWFNCFTFNNGVESNRIRDDYNAIQIDKGAKVSTTFEEEYKEETVKTGLIFSGIYNRKNGVNRLNQFIIAEDITKDLNPEYGAIQKLHTRDTDLIALCEDKVLRVLANKDALFNADGNVNITSNAAVLGQAIPFAGEYGISKNPESFASYTYRAYFTDKNRGKVLRLSLDGLTEISNYGMKDYFKDIFYSHSGFIHGSYDAKKDQYNLSIRGYESDNLNKSGIDETISYSEDVRGWVSKKDWIQEAGGSINNQYFTFYGGHADFHHNSGSSTLHGSTYKSDITFLLNGNPGNIKNFRTINYHGGSGWEVDSITTDKQSGSIDGATRDPGTGFIYKWREKEGIYYNYISGITENTKSNLDLKSLNVQGLGTPTGISGNDATFADLNNAIQVGDKVFNNNNSTVRTVTAISGNTITLDGAPENTFNFFSKDNKFNTSGVLGYYAEIKMETTNNISSSNRPELYSVGSEVSLSS